MRLIGAVKLPLALTLCVVAILALPAAKIYGNHNDFKYKWPWLPEGSVAFTTLPFQDHHANARAYDIDIGVSGTPTTIVSSTEGSVQVVDDQPDCNLAGSFGNKVIVTVGDGNVLTYAHLVDNIPLPLPDPLLQGDKIGEEGKSGNSINPVTGNCVPHLHWEFTSFLPTKIDNFATSSIQIGSNPSSSNELVGGLASTAGQAIRAEFADEGGWATLGWVTNVGRDLEMHRYGAGWEQTFLNHNGESGVYVPDSLITDAFWVQAEFWAAWQDEAGYTSIGYPVGDQESGTCPAGLPGGCTTYQVFECGYVWSDGANAPEVFAFSGLYILTSTPLFQQSACQSWSTVGGTPTGGSERLRYFGGGLMFHVGGGALKRSTDSGQNWSSLTPPAANYIAVDFDRCEGRLWGLWRNQDSTPDYFVYYSDDDGEAWTSASNVEANRTALRIACDPADKDRVAYTRKRGVPTKLRTVATDDSFASWTDSDDIPGSSTLQPGINGNIVWAANGDLLVTFTNASNSYLKGSDALGAMGSWTTRVQKSGAKFWNQIIRAGSGLLFAIKDPGSDHISVFRSDDDGATWDEFTGPGAGTGSELLSVKGLAYDPVAGILYLAGQDVGFPSDPNVFRMFNAATVAPASASWEALPNPSGDIVANQPLVLLFD